MENKIDIYQQRYLLHQERKRKMFTSTYGTADFKRYTDQEREVFNTILKNRSSQRTFNREPVDIDKILELAEFRPSSCDRRSVEMKVISNRDEKDLLSGLLVGGVGWINRADKILLCMAWEDAYKSPAEKDFMHYIDTGVLAQTVYLICESMNVGVCFVNPNIRPENKELFYKRFIPEGFIFTGALVVGNYSLKHTKNL